MVLDHVLMYIQFIVIALVCIALFVSVGYAIRFLSVLNNAKTRYAKTQQHVNTVVAKMELMQKQLSEIENTPIISPQLKHNATKAVRYGRTVKSVVQSHKKQQNKHNQKRNKNKKALRVQRKVSRKYGK